MSFRIGFMGSPAFSATALAALLAAGRDIVCVYAQPPRRAGRGQAERPTPVQALAEKHGLIVRTPRRLKSAEEHIAFADLRLDLALVVAYGLILPPEILAAPRLGCVNLHASLLPRWRGAAPIQRAIWAGDAQTGVQAMQMEAGLDTGPILASEAVRIGPRETFGALHDRLADIGAKLLVETIDGLEQGRLKPVPQAEAGIVYAAKIAPEEARIDWRRPAAEIDRQIRALSPSPGAWATARGERLKILLAEPVEGLGEPAAVLDDALLIACGEGALRLQRVQRAGRAAMDASTLLRGFPLRVGDRLD